MMLNLTRSKKYTVILLGGRSINADKAVELVLDKNKHLNFIYGLGVFIIYFYSKKSMAEIKNAFFTILKNECDLMYLFRYNKYSAQQVVPSLLAKINANIEFKQDYAEYQLPTDKDRWVCD